MWMSLWLIMTRVVLILKIYSWDMGNILHASGIVSLEGKYMVITLAREVIIGTGTIMLSLVEI
jgi:hypothetical protein